VFIDEVKRSGPGGLEGYHRARPPLTERLSIAEALVLADETRCPVNLLHLSSGEALRAAAQGRREFPHLDIRLETTLHHLALTHATAHGILGKVNPPIRTEADLVVLDPDRERVVTPDVLHSAQDFTPFAGMRVRGWPTHTILRGRVVFQDGRVQGRPAGEYVKRPVSRP